MPTVKWANQFKSSPEATPIMGWIEGSLLVFAAPCALGIVGRLPASTGVLTLTLRAVTVGISVCGVLLFVKDRIDEMQLVTFLAPLYQTFLATLLAHWFRQHYGRELKFILFETITSRELRPDSHVSTLYFAVAIAIPLLAIGLVAD
jgi:hypothetical protein